MLEPELANIAYAAAGSPVATALVSKIADALGWALQPRQIVRTAKAEAVAAQIRAQADQEGQDLIQRAATRALSEEIIQQQIIEQIIAKAISGLEDSATPDQIDNDWIANFFAKSKITSDEEMQNTWARILAGEANNPGSFSRKSVNLLADLDQHDAEAFSFVCNYAWHIRGIPRLLIYDLNHPTYAGSGLHNGVCSHLDDLGLIRYTDPIFSYNNVEIGDAFSYLNRSVKLTELNAQSRLSIGHAEFTLAGIQLYAVCEIAPVEGFYEYVLQQWSEQGFSTVSTPQ